jgi:transketolase
VIAPADPSETRQITRLLCKSKSPTYLRLGRSNEIQIVNSDYLLVENTVSEIRQGENGTLLFIGSIGSIALEAHEVLKSEGINVSVASSPFISQPDMNYLKRAIEKGPIVTIEEHGLRGGFGSSILEALSDIGSKPVIGLIGSKRKDLSLVGSRDFLLEANDLTSNEVVRKFKSLMES